MATESGMGVNFEDLRSAIDWSIKQLATPRQKRVEAIRQFVGSHYADGGTDKVVPTNFLELAVMIYTQQLAANAPRATFTAKVPRLKPFAYATEIALNQLPDEIGLGSTLRRAVVEALFSFGVVKVGMVSSGVEVLGHDTGQPFADLVPIDDYFCDMSAKVRGGIQFEGNDYWIPIADARAMWEGKAHEVQPDEHTVIGDQGEERAEGVTVDEGAELYKDQVWLRDVWLPRTNKLVTYGVKSHKVFNIVDWNGPEGGPYKLLGFEDVPGNLMPLPPVALWRDLHELGNTLFRKLGRQADAKKTVAVFPGGDGDGVAALQQANDGDGIVMSGAKAENITVGGIDAPTLAFYMQIRDLFSYFAGNLDTMGGLAPATDTIGQDKMLSEAASARIEYMTGRTLDFARDIFKALAWYEWTDPVRDRDIEKPVEGTDISVRSKWSAETREGDWLDYNFDIDVFSMQSDSPALKLQKIGHAIERYFVPLLPSLQQQGGQIDMKELTSVVSRLGNVPELNGIVRFSEPLAAQEEQGSSQPARMPANTTRTNVRVSKVGPKNIGGSDAMAQLLAGSAKPAEGGSS